MSIANWFSGNYGEKGFEELERTITEHFREVICIAYSEKVKSLAGPAEFDKILNSLRCFYHWYLPFNVPNKENNCDCDRNCKIAEMVLYICIFWITKVSWIFCSSLLKSVDLKRAYHPTRKFLPEYAMLDDRAKCHHVRRIFYFNSTILYASRIQKSRPQVVVCFCEGRTMHKMFKAQQRLRQAYPDMKPFQYICSDGWNDRLDVVDGVENEAIGSFSIR